MIASFKILKLIQADESFQYNKLNIKFVGSKISTMKILILLCLLLVALCGKWYLQYIQIWVN